MFNTVFEYFLKIDREILIWIQDNLRCELLSPVMKFITYLGNFSIIWILFALILIGVKSTRKAGATAVTALITEVAVVNLILKNLFERTRPYKAVEGLTRLIGKQNDFSFPSGHTAAAFSFSVAVFLCGREIKKVRKYGAAMIVLASAIAFSRLYVGVHYPSDVLAGAVIGVVIGFLAHSAGKKIFKLKPEERSEKSESSL